MPVRFPCAPSSAFFLRSIEPRAVDGAGQVGYEHAVTLEIERVPIPSIKWVNRICGSGRLLKSTSIGARLTVYARWVAAVRPVDQAIREIELDIDWLGQVFNSTSMSPALRR